MSYPTTALVSGVDKRMVPRNSLIKVSITDSLVPFTAPRPHRSFNPIPLLGYYITSLHWFDTLVSIINQGSSFITAKTKVPGTVDSFLFSLSLTSQNRKIN